LLICDPFDPSTAARIAAWIEENAVETLNVAGPSEGTYPGIGAATNELLARLFRRSTML
jgi:hypothetical protein